MNKRNLVCLCAVAALAVMGCNESKKWSDSPTCGNGIIERGEICDGSVNVSCSYFNPNVKWLTGTPGCSTNCELTQGSCSADPGIISQTCGNNQLDAGESCDGTQIADPNMNCEFFLGAGATGTVSCVNCQLSSSSCVPAGTSGNCGNGQLDAGETCDGSDFGGKTCIDFAGQGATGNLSCAANCVLDSTACVPATIEATCGNGKVEASEECDGDALNPNITGASCGSVYGGVSDIVTGDAKCTETCTIDMSECKYCGDGVVTTENGEECDTELEISGVTCETGKGPGSEGTVKCTERTCKYDYSECSDVEVPANCNDGNLDDDEECDSKDGNVIYKDDATCETIKGAGATGELSCSAACRIDKSACEAAVSEDCGNGALDDGEACDTVSGEVKYKDDATCETIKGAGFTGNLSCDKCKVVDTECKAAEPQCGDNALNGTEECETVDGQVTYIEDKTCESYEGKGATGELACNECAIDHKACKAAEPPKTCPNGKIDGEEECDGNDKIAANFSCGDGKKLITAGKVVCNDNCTVNKEQSCKDACGDTVKDSGEDCDGSVPATETCAKHDANKPEGAVKCTACKFDYSDCKAAAVTCPNGKIDGTEECDGNKVADGFSCGTGKKLKDAFVCKNDCTIDKAQSCIDACGDNVKDDGEDCDGTVPATETCAKHDANKPDGAVKCTACKFDYSDCKAASTTCTANATRCDGNKLYTCDSEGNNETSIDCPADKMCLKKINTDTGSMCVDKWDHWETFDDVTKKDSAYTTSNNYTNANGTFVIVGRTDNPKGIDDEQGIIFTSSKEHITATVSSGVSKLAVDIKSAYQSNNARTVVVTVNGTKCGEGSVKPSNPNATITCDSLTAKGSVEIKVTTSTSKQVIVDNLRWNDNL
ncbi:MAG: hypothetical protein IJM59_03390 [Proteobacteria bacterium]|nr:hypothetical protein [Pseudomonadota bacterium]